LSTPNSANALRKFTDPYWSAPGAALYLGDVRDVLRRLPARSAHCAVTSPPYWGLRDYGTGTWEGGSVECDHIEKIVENQYARMNGYDPKLHPTMYYRYKKFCKKCKACRVDKQLGSEDVDDCLGWATGDRCGECFVCNLVGVFAELWRVLRDDGTLWLNLGDTFDGGQRMIPAAVAMAMRANGWKLVQDIIWYASNKMPESVTNRCTKSHEHIFLLAKGDEYYYDHVTIQEPAKSRRTNDVRQDTANKRDVWVVLANGYAGAHFACFSPELITPCILAGTSEHGCCADCGAPYRRAVVKVGGVASVVEDESKDRSIPSNRNGLAGSGSTMGGVIPRCETAGWRKSCGCATDEVAPCVVIDPFCGSATTVATALQLGRAGVGIDLSEEYLLKCAIPRIVSAGDPRRPATSALPAAAPPIPPSWRG
jgi:DNA modification methylase